jgi:hypothetical protein
LAGANLKSNRLGSSNIDLLENRFVVVISTFYLFVKFTHHERIKTNNRCCFYLSPTVFATVFAIGLGKDELNLVKILSALLIFVGVYGDIQPKES